MASYSKPGISYLTLRILGTLLVPLMILIISLQYIGTFYTSHIANKLQTFYGQVGLMTSALDAAFTYNPLGIDHTHNMALALQSSHAWPEAQTLYIFDRQGAIRYVSGHNFYENQASQKTLNSLELLSALIQIPLLAFSEQDSLPVYPITTITKAADSADAQITLEKGIGQLSVWQLADGTILLSAATPLKQGHEIRGAVLVTRKSPDIRAEINQVGLNMFVILMGTAGLTILLGLYLSATIEKPLKMLATAAEEVEAGFGHPADIPNFAARRDEIGRLSVILKRMTQSLWEKIEKTEKFAADVAHELKNPLTSLKSAIETLQFAKNKADKAQLSAIIIQDLDRITRLINDIALASRVEAELAREGFSDVSAQELLQAFYLELNPLVKPARENTYPPIRYLYESKRISLIWSITLPHNLTIKIHKMRIIQVLRNIIDNALSFAPSNSMVNVRAFCDNAYVHIQIEDQGAGLPEGKEEDIFARFYTERPASDLYGNHSGLGLAIARQIIEAHKGYITASTKRDARGEPQGALFTFSLPL